MKTIFKLIIVIYIIVLGVIGVFILVDSSKNYLEKESEQNQTRNLSIVGVGEGNLTQDDFFFYQPYQDEPVIKVNKDFSFWEFDDEKCKQVTCECAKNTRTPCALFCVYCEELNKSEEIKWKNQQQY